MSYSKIIQIGNITKDLETRDVGGKSCLTFSMATNFKYGDKEEACFIDVTFWEKNAENIVRFFKKGDPILVEGELRQEKWTDRDSGQPRSKHVIRGQSWGFVGGKKEEGSASSPMQEAPPKPREQAPAGMDTRQPPPRKPPQGPELADDEIPF